MCSHNYPSSPLFNINNRPCRCRNFKDAGQVTFPHGGKTGHFALIGSELYSALQGFDICDGEAGAFAREAIDFLVECWGVAGMAKTTSIGHAAFSSVMLAAQWTACSLLVLLFGERSLRVSARVAMDCYGHVLARAHELGKPISAFTERPVEDFQRKAKSAYHRGTINGGLGETESLRQCNKTSAMGNDIAQDDQLREWTKFGCVASTAARLASADKKHHAKFMEKHAGLIAQTSGESADHLATRATAQSLPPRPVPTGDSADGGGGKEGEEDDDCGKEGDEDDDGDEHAGALPTRDDATTICAEDNDNDDGENNDGNDEDDELDDNVNVTRPPFEERSFAILSAVFKSATRVTAEADGDGSPMTLRVVMKASELRLYFEIEGQPRATSFLRIKIIDIFAYQVSESSGRHVTEVKLCLARSPDFSEFPPSSSAPRLNTTKGGRDLSPLAAASASAPLFVLRASRTPTDVLSEAMAAWAASDAFLERRRSASMPSPIPPAIDPTWLNDLNSEIIKPFPLLKALKGGPGAAAELVRLRAGFVALRDMFRRHCAYVRGQEGGKRIERRCGHCKKCVYISRAGMYATCGADTPHNSCVRGERE